MKRTTMLVALSCAPVLSRSAVPFWPRSQALACALKSHVTEVCANPNAKCVTGATPVAVIGVPAARYWKSGAGGVGVFAALANDATLVKRLCGAGLEPP